MKPKVRTPSCARSHKRVQMKLVGEGSPDGGTTTLHWFECPRCEYMEKRSTVNFGQLELPLGGVAR